MATFDFERHFLHDLPDDARAELLSAEARKPSTAAMAQTCDFARWPVVPTKVLIERDDRLFPAEFQRRVAKDRPGADADEIPRRSPGRAAILGSGTIGLLAILILRLRGIEVTAFARTPKPYLNSELIEAVGARYVSTARPRSAKRRASMGLSTSFSRPPVCAHRVRGDGSARKERRSGSGQRGRRKPDGGGPGCQDQPGVRNRQQGHGRDRQRQPGILEAAGRDLAMAEAQYPGWVAQLLAHPVQGLENYQQLIDTLTSGTNVIKAFCEIPPVDSAIGSAAVNGLASAH